MSTSAQIGVTGLAVMGSNLARNFARNGYTVAVHNRSAAKTHALIKEHGHEGDFIAAETAKDFVQALERPRRLVVMVKAGGPTDAVIEEFAPLLEPGDMIIDGGNAHFADTRRREAALREQGIHFVGAGISGGEEGALNDRASCPAARSSRTTPSARCWRRSPRRPPTARPVSRTWVPTVPGTS